MTLFASNDLWLNLGKACPKELQYLYFRELVKNNWQSILVIKALKESRFLHIFSWGPLHLEIKNISSVSSILVYTFLCGSCGVSHC